MTYIARQNAHLCWANGQGDIIATTARLRAHTLLARIVQTLIGV
jgi:hypothetical protein